MLYKIIFLNFFVFYLCLTQNHQKIKPVFIFAHGIFDSKKKGDEYKEMLEGTVISFDFDDSLVFPYLHRPFTTCFGQNAEIKKLEKIYNTVIYYFESKKLPTPPIILVGLSRGASVILNFLAIKKPKHIKAVILESPFDHMRYILENIISKTSGFSVLLQVLFCTIFPFYNKKGIQTVHIIKYIDKHIPLLFISSLQDQRVPHYHTLMLYYLLKQNDHKKVFLKVFETGKHAKIVKNNEAGYKEAVREFLKHNLKTI